MFVSCGTTVLRILHRSKGPILTPYPPLRYASQTPSGAILPQPRKTRFGIIGVLCAVTTGLLIGAAISKSIANFLEENDLFVPSEDDDEDD